MAFLFVFAWLGADWATKFQYGVMALLTAALVSFFVGGFSHWDGALLSANWAAPADGLPFWVLFALFFPAVTGFTQGVSMSGDLKDPGKSLPLGTFLAVGVSLVIYFGAALIFSGALPNRELTADYNAMYRVARYAHLIDAGGIALSILFAIFQYLRRMAAPPRPVPRPSRPRPRSMMKRRRPKQPRTDLRPRRRARGRFSTARYLRRSMGT